jgi:hypothetical protein
MAAIGFHVEHRDSAPRYDHDGRRDSRDYRRPPTREEIIIGGILGILGGR